MNETAIKKHLYKSDRIIIARTEDGLFAGDITFLLKLPENSKVFDSRRVFPIMPELGQTYVFCDFSRQDPTPKKMVQNLFERELKKELQLLKLTFWLYDNNNDPLQCFLMPDKTKVFIRRFYLNFLGDYIHYQYYTAGPQNAIIVRDHKDELAGVLMPVRADAVKEEAPNE